MSRVSTTMIEKGCAGERLRAGLKVTETLTSGSVYCDSLTWRHQINSVVSRSQNVSLLGELELRILSTLRSSYTMPCSIWYDHRACVCIERRTQTASSRRGSSKAAGGAGQKSIQPTRHISYTVHS